MKIHCHYRDYVLIPPHLLFPRHHCHHHYRPLSPLEEEKEQHQETVDYQKKSHGEQFQYLDAAWMRCIIERIWNQPR